MKANSNKPLSMKERVGQNLRNERLRLNYSQETFAEEIGASLKTLRDYETGERFPSMVLLVKIREKYGISIDAMIDNEPAEPERKRAPRNEIHHGVERKRHDKLP